MKKNNTSLNFKEITTIMINALSVKLFFTFPGIIISVSGNAAWIQIIFVSLISIILFFCSVWAYKKCDKMNILSISEKIGGKYLKAFVGFLLSIVLFFNIANIMRSFPEITKMVLLPNTPVELIVLIFAIVIGIAACSGLESIARIHSIFIPIILFIMILFFIFMIPNAKLYNLYPILGKGTQNIFIKGVNGITLFEDIILLNILLPYIENFNIAKKSGYISMIISSAAAFFEILLYCLVYPYPSSEKFLVPIFQLTRLIGIGDFFQRFEAFFEFIWSFSVFLYLSLYILTICLVWKDCFNLKYEKPIIFPILSVTVMFSFSSPAMQEVLLRYRYLTGFIIFMVFVLPILMPLIYKIKNKHK